MVTIISLGGSIVAPDRPDADFLNQFLQVVRNHLSVHSNQKMILIVGGGGPARVYQDAYRKIMPDSSSSSDSQDWIGIMATRLNAELVRSCLPDLCRDPVVTDPSATISFSGKVLVAAGWKPGFSTDFDSVFLAERFGAHTVINLSNIEKIFSDDPKKNAAARPLDHIGWNEFRTMVGDTWEPGKNVPFDPIASKRASELGLRVITASGRNLKNFESILTGGEFVGSTIGPE